MSAVYAVFIHVLHSGITCSAPIACVTWGCPENVHHSASTTKKRFRGHVLRITKPEKPVLLLLGFLFRAGKFLG